MCIFDAQRVFLPVSKNCRKGAFEKLPIESHISLVSETAFVPHSQSWVNPHSAEACTLLKSYVQVCREHRIHSKREMHTAEITSIVHTVSSHFTLFIHVFPANGVTMLMSAAAPLPPVPKHFEFFPLEKFGHASFSLGDSLILQSLWEFGMMRICQFCFVWNFIKSQQMLYRGFGANFYDD